MKRLKRCYLVRHAQTEWNRDHRIQGHTDLPLSSLGQEQATRLGQAFASRHLRAIFTSPLQRSWQTAQAIIAGNGHQVEPLVEAELAEMHLGAWEGFTPEEVDQRFEGAYRQWRLQPSSVSIPQAEPHTEFRQRVRRVLDKVLSSVEEGEFVVVSHGGVIAALLADLWQADYDALLRRLRLDNAGITALECGTGVPRVLWVNATKHLEELSSPDEGWY